MTLNPSVFHLKVQRVEQVCLFELAWGRGQHLGVTVPYPEILTQLYQDWHNVYLSFYKQALRGRVESSGKLSSPVDWHAKLVQAEAKLLYEFHRWLRHESLFEIRATLAKAASEPSLSPTSPHAAASVVDVFLSTHPLDLARLPWEAWEVGTEFAANGKIRIVRTALNIRETTISSPKVRRRKARILAILGDETGLNFQTDKEAVRSLSSLAEVKFVGWQKGQNSSELKIEIVKAITDERGWDILFFAGHSNETDLTGGELAIAPQVSISLNEIAYSLKIAKQRGLQFALFNSCKGLSFANALIDLGLNQVAVMREPIHNQVAQEFLLRFLRSLADFQDIHDALLAACQFLKLEKHLTYPSAYLVPSLFRHPEAPLFRLEPFSWKQKVKRYLPSKKEAIALLTLFTLSWQLPVQEFLLDKRVFVQAVYRQITNQTPPPASPPVTLISIDEESIRRAKISNPRPLNRQYLANIINQLSNHNAKVIGVDYLLDRYQVENDPILITTIQNSVKTHQTWFIFASQRNPAGGWFEILPELASPNWSLRGDLRVLGNPPRYMSLVPQPDSRPQHLPISYLLALGYWMNFQSPEQPPQPRLNSSVDWLTQLNADLIETTGRNIQTLFSDQASLNTLTNWAYLLRQWWLHPIIDFSIPPDRVYQIIPAWQLLEQSEIELSPAALSTSKAIVSKLADQKSSPFVVLIAPGGYGEAGVAIEGQDNYSLPMALRHWRLRQKSPDLRQIFPGGEAHAYMVHHFLNQRFVTPIPDSWMILGIASLGKLAPLVIQSILKKTRQGILLFGCGVGIYGLVSLQAYLTGAILLPWFFPTVTLGSYLILAFREQKFHG